METFPLVFFFIAFFYSSVGFGGGSSYLAILSLILSDMYQIRSTALILNICVVAITNFNYIRFRTFDWKSFWPFLALSVPMAFFTAQWQLSNKSFFILLGTTLIGAGLAMIIKHFQTKGQKRSFKLPFKIGLGGGIGFLSGLSGIGGGIYLSPFLNLVSWENSKKIASLASVFILFNSLAGLSGLALSQSLNLEFNFTGRLILAVGLGAGLGSYFSHKKINSKILSILTAVLVIYVGSKLVLKAVFDINI